MKGKGIIGIFLIFFSLVTVAVIGNMKSDNKKPVIKSTYNEVEALNLEDSYPNDPNNLISTNIIMTKCLYGGGINDEEIEATLLKQQSLFSADFIALNSFDIQLEDSLSRINKLRKMGLRILDFKVEPAVFQEENNKECTVDVLQITNTSVNTLLKYNLVQENNKWKIHSWDSQAVTEGEK